MNKIEACEKIIKQGGSCDGVKCEDCPDSVSDSVSHNIQKCFFENILKTAKQYLADHNKSEQEEKTYSIDLTENELYYLMCDFYDESLFISTKDKMANALKKTNESQPGDRCAFWDDYGEKENHHVSTLTGTINGYFVDSDRCWWDNCVKIKKEAELY